MMMTVKVIEKHEKFFQSFFFVLLYSLFERKKSMIIKKNMMDNCQQWMLSRPKRNDRLNQSSIV